MIDWVVVPFLVAFAAGLVLTVAAVDLSRRLPVGQKVRDDGPETHLRKAGTPSMGGVALLIGLLLCLIVLGVSGTGAAAVALLALGFAAIGLIDDVIKARGQQPRGWKARYRLAAELILALGFAWFVAAHVGTKVHLPGAGVLTSPWLFWPLSLLAIVGGGNAVNLTDGLDGLASGLVALCAASLAAGAALHGHNAAAAVAAITAGLAAGFLMLNRHPAAIFMGDTGSLMFGALLGGCAVMSGLAIPFAVAGLIFVAEALSVMAQVVSFQLTGRRVLRMAPLHHHFELGGWPETVVTHRFLLVGIALAALGFLLATPG
ncbi:MAG: phospho-N-acetylmuramoyl-pentapeptide-transferase [Armatimonadota bacterium]